MTDVTPFLFEADDLSAVVRATQIDGVPWIVGSDAAAALGYARPNDAIAQHVDPEDRDTTAIRRGTPGNPNVTIINESGLYSLIFGSNLPAAKEFKRWVTSEVLPAVRREGGYIRPDASVRQLEDLALRATTLAEAQARMLKAAEGIVDPKWLEAKTRHVIARGLGEEPEIAPSDRPLTVGEYLEEKGVGGAALRTTSPAFGKAVKAEYRARHGRDPMPVERFVSGALRPVAGYTEIDRPIFDAVWARTRAVIQ